MENLETEIIGRGPWEVILSWIYVSYTDSLNLQYLSISSIVLFSKLNQSQVAANFKQSYNVASSHVQTKCVI